MIYENLEKEKAIPKNAMEGNGETNMKLFRASNNVLKPHFIGIEGTPIRNRQNIVIRGMIL